MGTGMAIVYPLSYPEMNHGSTHDSTQPQILTSFFYYRSDPQGVRPGQGQGDGYGYGPAAAAYPDERGVPAHDYAEAERNLLQRHLRQTLLLRKELLHFWGHRMRTVSTNLCLSTNHRMRTVSNYTLNHAH